MTPSSRPILVALTSHWVAMTGTALVTLAGFSWLFLLPLHISGRANNPYIGLLAFIALPLIFFCGLALLPIGIALGKRRLTQAIVAVPDRRAAYRRAGIFFAVMTLANLVIGSQLSYRAVAQMETVQFCGQTCHVMKPEFTAHLSGASTLPWNAWPATCRRARPDFSNRRWRARANFWR